MIRIERSNVCDAYEEDTERLFASRECWYCKYGDFGINTGSPTQLGVCLNKTIEKKIEEETNEKAF